MMIIFQADDALMLYLLKGDTMSVYMFDKKTDINIIQERFNIHDIQVYDVGSLNKVLNIGDVIESVGYIYVVASEGVEVYPKIELLKPIISATVGYVSEASLMCGYNLMLPIQRNRLERYVFDIFKTMRNLPENIIFPIFAQYRYTKANENIDDRIKMITVKTSSDWWKNTIKDVRFKGYVASSYYLFSYFAKFMFGIL